jgi:hypothetical protein
MRRLRTGAYTEGNYLIRYLGWLEGWDGPREKYLPWHVFRRASHISDRVLLDRAATLEDAKALVRRHLERESTGA